MASSSDDLYPLATANEVDLELPQNLLSSQECVLCGVKFTNTNMFASHVEGLKHQGKKSTWLRKQYEAMGINAGGWLVNPVTQLNKQKKAVRMKRLETEHKPLTAPVEAYVAERGYREDNVPRDVGKGIGCPQCRVFFKKMEDRAAHKQTPHHALVIWELSKGHVRPGTSISIFASAYKHRDFQCVACEKKLLNATAFEAHIAGGQHLKIAKRIKEHGDVFVKEAFVPKSNAEKRRQKKERKLGILERSNAEVERSVKAGVAPVGSKRNNLGPGAMIEHAAMFADCEPPLKMKPSFGSRAAGKKGKASLTFVPSQDTSAPASFGLGQSFNSSQPNRVQMTGMAMIDFSSQPVEPSTAAVPPPLDALKKQTSTKPAFGAMDFLNDV